MITLKFTNSINCRN